MDWKVNLKDDILTRELQSKICTPQNNALDNPCYGSDLVSEVGACMSLKLDLIFKFITKHF